MTEDSSSVCRMRANLRRFGLIETCILATASIFVVCLMSGCERIQPERMKSEELFKDANVLALARAIEAGDTEAIERLIDGGVDVNSSGRGNTTLLARAIVARNKASYKLLLQLGASPNILDDRGIAVVHLATYQADPYWLSEALQSGGDPNLLSAGNTLGAVPPIFFAIDESLPDHVRLLINHGADVNFQNSEGDCPLYYAALKKRYDIVLDLLRGGANIRVKNRFGHDVYSITWYVDPAKVDQQQAAYLQQVKSFIADNALQP